MSADTLLFLGRVNDIPALGAVIRHPSAISGRAVVAVGFRRCVATPSHLQPLPSPVVPLAYPAPTAGMRILRGARPAIIIGSCKSRNVPGLFAERVRIRTRIRIRILLRDEMRRIPLLPTQLYSTQPRTRRIRERSWNAMPLKLYSSS